MTIPGRWQDGATSAELPAELQVRGDLVHLMVDGRELCAARLQQIKISPRLGRTPRYLSFPAFAGQFETCEHGLMEQLESLDRRPGSLAYRVIHRIEQNLLAVVLATLVVVGAVVGYFAWGLPAMSHAIAERLPMDMLDEAAAESLAFLEEHQLEASDLSEARREEVLTAIATVAPDYPREKLRFYRGGHHGANAFALPDGTIVFTDELVALADNSEEVVAIFGHELGHVENRHALQQIIQGSAISLTIALVTGDVSIFGDLLVTAPVIFARLSYSRQFELESDAYALDLLREHGLDTGAFVSILTKLHHSHRDCDGEESCAEDGTDSDWGDYLSTHPHLEQRIRLAAP